MYRHRWPFERNMKNGHRRQSHMLTGALYTHRFRACALKIYTLNHQTLPPRHQKILRRLLYLNLFLHFLVLYLFHPHASSVIPGQRQIPRSLFQISLFHDCWSMPSPMSPGSEASGRQHSLPSQPEPKWRKKNFASSPGDRGDFSGISQMICLFVQASERIAPFTVSKPERSNRRHCRSRTPAGLGKSPRS